MCGGPLVVGADQEEVECSNACANGVVCGAVWEIRGERWLDDGEDCGPVEEFDDASFLALARTAKRQQQERDAETADADAVGTPEEVRREAGHLIHAGVNRLDEVRRRLVAEGFQRHAEGLRLWLALLGKFATDLETGEPERLLCRSCGQQAACVGAYEDEGEAYSCDSCCGHGNEDGYCTRLSDLAATTEAAEKAPSLAGPTVQALSEAWRAALRAELAAAKAELAYAGRVMGQVCIIPTLQGGEELAEPLDHAAVAAASRLLERCRTAEQQLAAERARTAASEAAFVEWMRTLGAMFAGNAARSATAERGCRRALWAAALGWAVALGVLFAWWMSAGAPLPAWAALTVAAPPRASARKDEADTAKAEAEGVEAARRGHPCAANPYAFNSQGWAKRPEDAKGRPYRAELDAARDAGWRTVEGAAAATVVQARTWSKGSARGAGPAQSAGAVRIRTAAPAAYKRGCSAGHNATWMETCRRCGETECQGPCHPRHVCATGGAA